MINKSILVGRLGADPTVRYTNDGKMITSFDLATSEKWKDEEHTEWHKCVTFGKLAEICGNYLKKGALIYFEGRSQTRSWEDKEGVKRYTTEVVGVTMKMLERKTEQANEQGQTNYDEDVPF